MDGFALRAADTPGTLPVVARVAAGRPASPRARRGRGDGDRDRRRRAGRRGRGRPDRARHGRGRHRRRSAAPSPRATTSARAAATSSRVSACSPPGRSCPPSRLAALASAGVAEPRCARRPRVAIVTTGTELRRPGEQLARRRDLRVERRHARGAAPRAWAPTSSGSTASPTTRRRTTPRSQAGSRRTSLVTSGGVSVGPHDLVRATVAKLGAEEVFWGVAMRPGKPLSFAVRGATLVFGLPGNPVSSLVGALLFVLPAIRALQGAREPRRPVRARHARRAGARGAAPRRLPARAARGGGRHRRAPSRSRARSRT